MVVGEAQSPSLGCITIWKKTQFYVKNIPKETETWELPENIILQRGSTFIQIHLYSHFPTHVYQYFIYLAVHWPLIWIIHSSKTCNVFIKLVNKMCNRQSMLRLLQWHLCHVYRIQLNYEASSRTLTIQLTLDFSCTSKLVQAFWIPWFTDFYWHIHENLHQIFCSNHCGSTIIWKQQCTWRSNYLNEIRIWQ